MDPLLRAAGRLERLLGRAAVICVMALLASQVLMAGRLAPWLGPGADPLEGLPAAVPALGSSPPRGQVTLAAAGCGGVAHVLVNGRRAASFLAPTATVTVAVGDVVAIDARPCRHPGRFRLEAAVPETAGRLAVGRVWTGRGRVIVLGTVDWGSWRSNGST